jgi:hypothetical protein
MPQNPTQGASALWRHEAQQLLLETRRFLIAVQLHPKRCNRNARSTLYDDRVARLGLAKFVQGGQTAVWMIATIVRPKSLEGLSYHLGDCAWITRCTTVSREMESLGNWLSVLRCRPEVPLAEVRYRRSLLAFSSLRTPFLNREGRLGDSARLGRPCTLKSGGVGVGIRHQSD